MKIIPLILFLGFLLHTPRAVSSQLHEFTSSDGLKISASILACQNGKVTIVRSDGKEFTVDKSRFSVEDQIFIEDWKQKEESRVFQVASNSRFKVEVGFKKKSKLDPVENYDDRIETLFPKVTLKNDELYQSYGPIEGFLLIMGESVHSSDRIKILSKQRVAFSKVGKQSEEVWHGKAFRNEYDNKRYAQFGYKFKGYMLMLKNKDGPIFYSKSSVASWLNRIDQIDRLSQGKVYNRKLEINFNR